jgi:hypothetical protein
LVTTGCSLPAFRIRLNALEVRRSFVEREVEVIADLLVLPPTERIKFLVEIRHFVKRSNHDARRQVEVGRFIGSESRRGSL